LSHKLEVGERRYLACHYTLTTGNTDINLNSNLKVIVTYRIYEDQHIIVESDCIRSCVSAGL